MSQRNSRFRTRSCAAPPSSLQRPGRQPLRNVRAAAGWPAEGGLPRLLAPLAAAFVAVAALSACEAADTPSPDEAWYGSPEQPEIPSGYHEKPGWATEEYAVAAAHPLASDAGAQVIEAGGSAVDAAVAVQAVLTLVEPQSSGIGGGAFLLHWDGAGVDGYNGRETAPAAADEELFLDEDGEALPFSDAVRSGLSVGVPGTLAMLHAAHQDHGELEWAELFQPAIALAEDGFEISPRLNRLLDADGTLREDPVARELYYDEDGDAHPVGHVLRNPALAEVLRGVANEGLDAFYQGPVAEDIAARVQGHPERPGGMTVEDIAAYPDQDLSADPICTPWRDYTLCGFPPPTSGHLAVAQILGIVEALDPPADALASDTPNADFLHLYLEAAKLAFADRNLYVGDPDFVDPPDGDWESMLNPAYLAERAALVGEESMGEAEPGDPGQVDAAFGPQPQQPEGGTSHVSIVDRDGNAVSLTTTIEQGFGSRMMSDGGTGLLGGFHLNNELTDFSRTPVDDQGRPIANRPEAGKRPRSSMSPTVVLDGAGEEFVAATGSPGGAGIIHYTAKSILGMLAWDLNAQEAIDLANFVNYNSASSTLERDRFDASVIEALEARGHEVSEGSLTSGIQAIQRTEDGWFGGADPRREGVVEGR